MLDKNIIRNEPDRVKTALINKNSDPGLVDNFLETDAQWRSTLSDVEKLKAERNKVSDAIASIKKEKGDASSQIARMAEVKQQIQTLDEKTRELETHLDEILLQIPNMPHESAPIGKSEENNVIRRTWGEQRQFDFQPKPHWEIAECLHLIDFARGAKVAGSGFLIYTGMGARLERAIINFMLDVHTKDNRYIEIMPPFIVNRASYVGTGQLPKFQEEIYTIDRDDLFLISTAEVPVTNLYRDEILSLEQLPIYHTAYSACFRREAGAAGKDTRGLLRLHEFNKVELVKFVAPENSYDEHTALCEDAEKVLKLLNLPYRINELCTGDMSFSAAKCYDIELYSPGVDRWLEVSSCSNFEDFQARRANIRFRREAGGKPEFVHTLNASGVATPRLMAALLENYQQADGSIAIPSALQPYFGAERIK